MLRLNVVCQFNSKHLFISALYLGEKWLYFVIPLKVNLISFGTSLNVLIKLSLFRCFAYANMEIIQLYTK